MSTSLTYHHSLCGSAGVTTTPFLIDLNVDQQQFLLSNSEYSPIETASSSSSSLLFPSRSYYPDEVHQVGTNYVYASDGGSSEHPLSMKNEVYPNNDELNSSAARNKEFDGSRDTIDINHSSSVKWMSSKMRLMKKMINTPEADNHNLTNDHHMKKVDHKGLGSPTNNSNNSLNRTNSTNTIRVCSDCNTTKTPLWRSGPSGPKSLCNACGIRQRKARRAMAAVAPAANGTTTAKSTNKIQQKQKKVMNSHLPFKKRCNFTTQSRGRKKLCNFEDLRIVLSKNSAFQRVFAQDEKEGAILLMALSYGLVHG